MGKDEKTAQLGPVVVKLMQGVVYRDQHEAVWQDLLGLRAQVVDYLKVIGLTLEVDEAEGYAFLRQLDEEKEGRAAVGKLIQRRPLSYPVSLLCVLLRKKLVESDAQGDVRVILTREQMVEMLRVFLPEQSNEAKLVDKIKTYINKVTELGFLRKHQKTADVYEVRRIIKALVDADWLSDLDEKMKVYHEHSKKL